MKFRLVKETLPDRIRFYTESKDETSEHWRFVDGTIAYKEEDAIRYFDMCVSNNATYTKDILRESQ